MSFLYFRFLYLKFCLFHGVVCLLVGLLLYYFVMGLIKFLLGSIATRLLFFFSLKSAHESGKVVSPTHWPPLNASKYPTHWPPLNASKYPWYSFLLGIRGGAVG